MRSMLIISYAYYYLYYLKKSPNDEPKGALEDSEACD